MKNENKKIPQIRFKGFDIEWTSKKYTEVFDTSVSNNTLSRAELTTEKTSTKNVHYGDVLIKYNSILDVKNDEFPFIPDEIKIDSKDLLKNGDLVFADTAEDETCGKATEIFNLGNEKVTAGLHTFVARPKEKFESKYLGYYINSPAYHNQLLPYMQGTKVTSISKSNIQKTKVEYPDSNEQTKLGTLFSEIDSLIISTQKEHDKLVTLKKSMLYKMFPKKGSLIPEIRFKGFTDNWEEKKLNEYLEPSKLKNLDNKYSKQDVLSVSGEYGIVNQIEFQGRSFAGVFVNNYGIVETNDIVYTKSPLSANPYGIIKNNFGPTGIVSTLYAVYKTKENVDSAFVQRYFDNNNRLNDYLRPLVRKGAKNDMKVSSSDALLGLVKFPKSYSEQKKIGDYFQNLDNLISKQSAELDKLKNVRKTLLSKMFVQGNI